MATRKAAKRRAGKSLPSAITILIIILFVLVNGFNYFKEDTKLLSTNNDSDSCVHFIDVGQGSSTLIQSGSKGILIDAGEKEYADKVINYIKSCGVKELEYVIASHPHTDHIGALSKVIEAVETKNIIMPKLSAQNMPTTRTYENLLLTIKDKGIKAIAAKYGSVYSVDDIRLEILGPIEQNKDLNNMSVVCKATVLSTSFMLLADAETQELKTIFAKGANLESTFILMGHHGSRTSLFYSYLDSVNAKAAVISCGANNSYGHPHEEAIDYLNDSAIKYFRTDESGTIVVNCFDEGYNIKTEKG